MRPYVNEDLCITCGTCEAVCPADPNVFIIEEVSRVVNPESCTECEECVENCPSDAIKLESK